MDGRVVADPIDRGRAGQRARECARAIGPSSEHAQCEEPRKPSSRQAQDAVVLLEEGGDVLCGHEEGGCGAQDPEDTGNDSRNE